MCVCVLPRRLEPFSRQSKVLVNGISNVWYCFGLFVFVLPELTGDNFFFSFIVAHISWIFVSRSRLLIRNKE